MGARRFIKRFSLILTVLLILLIAVRAALPWWIERYVNRTLDRIPDYDGRIGDVDLALFRGAYSIEDIKIVKTTGKVPVPFFEAPLVDFSLQWGAIFQGKLVGEIVLDQPIINFVNAPNPQASQISIDDEWLRVVKDLFPFRINRFEIDNGQVHFRDFHHDPKVDVTMTRVNIIGKNFSNTREAAQGLVASIEARGLVEDQAEAKAKVHIAPAERAPTFNLDASLRNLALVKLNDFLKAYVGVDAEAGTVSVDSELAADKEGFRGYIKPLVQDAKILEIENDADNPLQLIWESIVALGAEIFENQRHEQIGTRIEISGKFDDSHISTWESILGVLRNAFVRAFKPGVENEVGLKGSQ